MNDKKHPWEEEAKDHFISALEEWLVEAIGLCLIPTWSLMYVPNAISTIN